jgi:RimJ/RimL family protein N-acetyltransferase
MNLWAPEDAPDFYELSSDEGFNLYPINVYRQADVEGAREWIKNAKGKFSVRLIETNDLIGMGGLTPWTWEGEALTDITYRLRTSAWGKGFGPELAFGLVRYGFDVLKLDQITATITPDNLPSKKIAEKLGLKFDKRILLQNVPTDLYRLFRS